MGRRAVKCMKPGGGHKYARFSDNMQEIRNKYSKHPLTGEGKLAILTLIKSNR